MKARLRRTAALGVLALATAAFGAVAGASVANPVELPLPQAPVASILGQSEVQLPPDRLLVSKVPGSVTDAEVVTVDLDGGGDPAQVRVEQRIVLTGTGDYVIRERGPARAVTPIGDSLPPVLARGAVVWQGFSPGRRELGAVLDLDPALEVARLPLGVTLSFRPDGGDSGPVGAGPVGAGGSVDGPGTLTIALVNLTALEYSIANGRAQAPALAPIMQTFVDAAAHPGHRIPTAGRGLPAAIAGSVLGGTETVKVSVPLHLTGTVGIEGTGATISGYGVSSPAGHVSVDGVLQGNSTITARVEGPGKLQLELTALPGLDPAELVAPKGSRTWGEWLGTDISQLDIARATNRLTHTAAQAAGVSLIVPYLSANLTGDITSSFVYRLAPVVQIAQQAPPLRAKPIPIAIAALALLVVLVGLDRLRRRL